MIALTPEEESALELVAEARRLYAAASYGRPGGSGQDWCDAARAAHDAYTALSRLPKPHSEANHSLRVALSREITACENAAEECDARNE